MFIIVWVLFVNVDPNDINANKYTLLSHIDAKYKPDTFMYNKSINLHTLQYPVIFKPIICSAFSKGVKVINNIYEAQDYLLNCVNLNEILIQTFVPYKTEVGLLYETNIFTNKGQIISLVQKTSKNTNIMKGCHLNGIQCTDLTSKITPKLTHVINKISSNIPNYNMGRYDIKCKNIESLLEGKDFYILEANGTLGADLRKSYNNILHTIVITERWFFVRILFGIKNIFTLQGYNPITLIYVLFLRLYNAIKCADMEKLYAID